MAGRQSLPPGWVHRVRSCACVRVCVRACDQHATSECTYVHNDSKNSKHHRRLGERILSDAQCAQKNVNRNVKIRFDSPDTHARPFEKVVSLAFQTAICPCWFWSHTMMIVLRPSSKISKLQRRTTRDVDSRRHDLILLTRSTVIVFFLKTNYSKK